jgi:transcriptional regulator with XRE-family HTH domain
MKTGEESFALKLNQLFQEKRKPDGGQYTQTEVVESTKGILTRVYLWKLRKGIASNPGLKVIQALARFFSVTPCYFLESDAIKGKPPNNSQKRDAMVDRIAFGASQLDSKGKQAVLYMIESILKSKK